MVNLKAKLDRAHVSPCPRNKAVDQGSRLACDSFVKLAWTLTTSLMVREIRKSRTCDLAGYGSTARSDPESRR
jgi:hypothetical protein